MKIYNGEIAPVDAAIFADTGNEPKEVYDWFKFLEEKVSDKIKIEIVNNDRNTGDITKDLMSPVGFFASIPVFVKNPSGKQGLTLRTCTDRYKIQPINKRIREILGVTNLRGKVVEIVMGISQDEIQRAKYPPNKWAINCYPLIENKITRDDCKHWIKHNGYAQPPRSACIICPYHRNDEWLHLKTNYKDEFDFAVWFDEQLRSNTKSQFVNKLDDTLYLHDSRKPLKNIEFANIGEQQYKLFDDECDGYCGT